MSGTRNRYFPPLCESLTSFSFKCYFIQLHCNGQYQTEYMKGTVHRFPEFSLFSSSTSTAFLGLSLIFSNQETVPLPGFPFLCYGQKPPQNSQMDNLRTPWFVSCLPRIIIFCCLTSVFWISFFHIFVGGFCLF